MRCGGGGVCGKYYKTVVAVVAQTSNSDLTTNEQYSRMVFVHTKRF